MRGRTRTAAAAAPAAVAVAVAMAVGPVPGGAGPAGAAGASQTEAAGAAEVAGAAARAGIRVTTLAGLGTWARVYDVNERGRAVGEAGVPEGNGHGVLWEGATPVDITPDVAAEPPFGPSATARRVNDRGQVLGAVLGGFTSFRSDAFLWEDGERTAVGPTGTFTSPVDLTEDGRAVVDGFWPDRGPGALVWDDGTEVIAPPVEEGGPLFYATDMNERGLLAGVRAFSLPQPPYTWRPGRAPRALPVPPGTEPFAAYAVNDRGDVAGLVVDASATEYAPRVVRWRDGRAEVLGTLGGARADLAPPGHGGSPINRRGDIVGAAQTATGDTHAVLWRDGRAIDLGTLGGPTSGAVAINDRGQVVGTSETASGERHAFLWQDGRMVDLTALAGGGTNAMVTDINDRGQVVGYADPPGGRTTSYRWDVPAR